MKQSAPPATSAQFRAQNPAPGSIAFTTSRSYKPTRAHQETLTSTAQGGSSYGWTVIVVSTEEVQSTVLFRFVSSSSWRPRDLAPITIEEIRGNGLRLIPRSPLTFTPVFDQSGKLLCAEDDLLNVHAFARDRRGLIEELERQILMLWREYALEDDDRLSAAAKRLKRALKERLEVSGNAQGKAKGREQP